MKVTIVETEWEKDRDEQYVEVDPDGRIHVGIKAPIYTAHSTNPRYQMPMHATAELLYSYPEAVRLRNRLNQILGDGARPVEEA